MEKKFVFTGDCFILPKHFIEFAESIGYTKDNMTFNIGDECADIWWDSRTVEYVESHLDYKGRFMKGEISSFYRIGFAGAIQVFNVDTDKNWRLTRKRIDGIQEFVVEYVDFHRNDKGKVWIASEFDVVEMKQKWKQLIEEAKTVGDEDMRQRCEAVYGAIDSLLHRADETILKI